MATSGPSLGEALLAEGLIDEGQLDAARADQTRSGRGLAEALVHVGAVEEGPLVRALSRRYRCPAVDLASKSIDRDVVALLPHELAWKHRCLPLFLSRGGSREVLFLGVEDPGDLDAIDDVGFRTGLQIRPVVVGPRQLRDALVRIYGASEAPAELAVMPEAQLLQTDTAPLVGGLPAAEVLPEAPPQLATAAPTGGPGGEAGRDLRTRRILQALTRLLISKQVITRQELIAELSSLGDADEA